MSSEKERGVCIELNTVTQKARQGNDARAGIIFVRKGGKIVRGSKKNKGKLEVWGESIWVITRKKTKRDQRGGDQESCRGGEATRFVGRNTYLGGHKIK